MKDYNIRKLFKVTKEEADDDFQKLVANTPSMKSHIGNKAVDFYTKHHRLRTIVNNKMSLAQAFEKPDVLLKLEKFAMRLRSLKKSQVDEGDIAAAFRLSVGSNNQFKASYAKFMYKKFGARNILDPTAGWGGRCVGAMALGLNYTGVDSNTTLKSSYNKMIKRFNVHKSKIHMIWKSALQVDYSKIKYDFVLTSPPYYNLEIYPKSKHFSTEIEWNKHFYTPLFTKVWKGLDKGGWMCINIKNDVYKVLKKFLGKCDTKVIYPKSSRPSGLSSGKKNIEFTYCWKK